MVSVRLMRRVFLSVGVLAILFQMSTFGSSGGTALAADPPRLRVNGQEVLTDVPPQIEQGRTLVPLRFAGEALGYRVTWLAATQTVLMETERVVVRLRVSSRLATVGSRTVTLDVAPRIVNDRVMVPARFLAEVAGASVVWDDATRTVWINTEGASPALSVPPLTSTAPIDLATIPLGTPTSFWSRNWGSPFRQDLGQDGLIWWVYRPAADRYFRLGFDGSNHLVGVYAAGRGWSYRNVDRTTAPRHAIEMLGISSRVEVTWRGTQYTFLCEEREGGFASGERLPLLAEDGKLITFFLDAPDERLAAVQVLDLDTFMSTNPLRIDEGCRLRATGPIPVAVHLEGDRLRRAELDAGRAMHDLVNVERVLRNLQPVSWDSRFADMARRHAQDMQAQGFFSHVSPTRGSLQQRLRAAGLDACGAGENLALGYEDAVAAHHGLMNSPSHRRTALDPRFTRFGAAAAGLYYAQNFGHCP